MRAHQGGSSPGGVVNNSGDFCSRRSLDARTDLVATTLRTRPPAFKARLVERFAAEALPAIADGTYEHVIDSTFQGGLARAHDAQEYMLTNANLGKIVIGGIAD